MSSPNILISGSGIAAGVFAHWTLVANPNANITIVERYPSLRLTGASVDIRSSAVDIIQWMGAEQEIRKHSTNEEGVQWVRNDGRPIATMRATGRTDIQTMTSEFEIFRGGLAKIFMDPIMDKVKVIFDETVEKYEQHDDGVLVTFTKSQETKKYDILVAADGFGSKIRGLMLNSPSREQVFDEGVHAAYFTVDKDLLQGSKLAKWHNTTGGRCIFIRPDPSPGGRTRCHFMNVTTPKDVAMKRRLDDALAQGHEAYMSLMEELFADFGWLAPEVLKGMRESTDFYCSLFGQIRCPRFCDGRVVLIGDAGYATPGIGTSLAIMGGYALAGELSNTPSDPVAALKRYEDLMRPFIGLHQGGVGDNAMQYLVPQTKWGIWIRDLVLSTVMGLRLDQLLIRLAVLFGYKEKKLDFPEYKWPGLETKKEK